MAERTIALVSPCIRRVSRMREKPYKFMYYIYILRSKKDGNLYIGFTTNLKQRIVSYNCSKVRTTKNRRPLNLICYEAYIEKTIALKREKFLKSSDGHKDIARRNI